jgi:hypothetical protein
MISDKAEQQQACKKKNAKQINAQGDTRYP